MPSTERAMTSPITAKTASRVPGRRARFSEALAVFLVAGAGIAIYLSPGAGAAVALGALAIAAAAGWRAARAETRVEMLEGRLRDEHSYQVFIDNAIEGFFRTTRSGRYLKVNRALANIYGYDTPEELMNEVTDIERALYIDPLRRDAFLDIMKRDGMVHDFISQIRRRDGTVIWIAENARGMYDEDGQFLFYEGTVEDITPQRQVEEALRGALKESHEGARAKAAFLAAMSHELKTPLNAVIGFSELILHEIFGPVGNPKYRGYIADIHSNGRRLLDMINDVLDLTRIEGGLLALEDSTVSLADIVPAVCEAASFGRGDPPLIGIDMAGALPNLRADARRLRQILTHVVSNAVKFTPSGGRVTVQVGVAANGGLTLIVSDTGIGIAEELIAHALEPFKQLDTRLARRFEGVGLGLPLAHALTRLHGGSLTIASVPGKGTSVTVAFPADRTVGPEIALCA